MRSSKILLLTITLLSLVAKATADDSEITFNKVFWEEEEIVFIPALGEKKLANDNLGELRYNLLFNREEKCNEKSTRFAMYSADGKCINISSDKDTDYTIKKTSKGEENLAFQITMKNGEPNAAGVASSTQLTFQCDPTKDYENILEFQIEKLKVDQATNVYSSTTVTKWACTVELVKSILVFTNKLRWITGLLFLIIGILIIVGGIKFFKFVIIFFSASTWFTIVLVILLFKAFDGGVSAWIVWLSLIFGLLLGVAIGFCLVKCRKNMVGILGAYIGFLIGSFISSGLTFIWTYLSILGFLICLS